MLEPARNLGPYKLIGRIGAGGMGEVWKAEDTRLGRIVAIKILPPKIAANPEAIARMRREARTAAQLNHPSIATIHSFEQDGDRLFIVMELVEGEPLTAIIARGALPETEVSRIGRSVADALVEAHGKGIVHRDIKPDNIIVSSSRVKVLDFGIAKRIGFEPTTSETPTAFVTQEGMIIGTVHYMSPEQALGKPLDARTDIFSLGVVLYQAATGRQPFGGETITETITQIIRDEPAAPRRVNPSITPGLNAIIQRCMRKNRDERFASSAELAGALAAPATVKSTKPAGVTPAAEPARGRRFSASWIGAVVVLLLAVIAAVYSHQHRNVPPPVQGVVPATQSVAPPSSAAPPVPSTTTVEVPAPASAAEVGSATQTAPPEPAPSEHLTRGLDALFSRNFGAARHQFKTALENPEALDARQQQLARLGLAIASGDRPQAQEIAREIHEASPDDPDLERIRRAFAMAAERGGPQRRRPWKPRAH
jgi:serine/threonine protein kinase